MKNYGYREKINNRSIIVYQNEDIDKEIIFWLPEKTFETGTNYRLDNITMAELKAINEKVKELGWEE